MNRRQFLAAATAVPVAATTLSLLAAAEPLTPGITISASLPDNHVLVFKRASPTLYFVDVDGNCFYGEVK